jgi:WD40 repeat protein
LAFGATGDLFLLATPESMVKVFSREGELKATFSKGDPYIRDPKRTVGHTAQITAVKWAPNDKKACYTSSYDSTIRLWNVENPRKHVWVIPVKSKVPGGRTPITSVCMSPDSRMISGGAEDGVLRIWSTKAPFVLPTHCLENAHEPGKAISSVLFKRDGHHLFTRGCDHTVKLFDIRSFKKPLATVTNVFNMYESTNILLSPDEKYILTGSSLKKSQDSAESGYIKIFDSSTLKQVREVDMGPVSVVHLHWHTRINQVFAGLSDGGISVLYNPSSSCAGILEPLERQVKKRAVDDIEYNTGLIEVEAEEERPQFPEEYLHEQQDERLIDELRSYVDPRDLRKPELPGRRVRPSYGHDGEVSRKINEDPRQAILSHAEEALNNPYWVAPAYKKTQPNPVYSSSVYANEEEAKREAKKRRRQ